MVKNPESKTWGSTGTEFPNGYNYEEEERPVDEFDDFVNWSIVDDIHTLFDAFGGVDGVESFNFGVISDRPPAGSEGAIYFATDEGRVYGDDGSKWIAFGLTQINQLSTTAQAGYIPVAQSDGTIEMEKDGGALFEETASIELLFQWRNLLEGNESDLETYMSIEKQADAIADSEMAMKLIYHYS
jgi:hypothetical protein